MQVVEVAGGRASYRAYGAPGAAGMCDAEPRFLVDELSSVNGLLTRFLDASDLPTDQRWTERQVSLVDGALAQLPKTLDDHRRNLKLLKQCRFEAAGGLAYAAQRGQELLPQVEARLAELPARRAATERKAALEDWKAALPDRRSAAKGRCPAKNTRPFIYFAWRDPGGTQTWLFCDGATLREDSAGATQYEPPLGRRPSRRAPTEKDYLTAAANYPAVDVERPPDADGRSAKR